MVVPQGSSAVIPVLWDQGVPAYDFFADSVVSRDPILEENEDDNTAQTRSECILPGVCEGSERYSNVVVVNDTVDEIRIYDEVTLLHVSTSGQGQEYVRKGTHPLDGYPAEHIYFEGNEVQRIILPPGII